MLDSNEFVDAPVTAVTADGIEQGMSGGTVTALLNGEAMKRVLVS